MVADAKSYKLPDETLPSLGLSYYLDNLVEMRNFLTSRGIQTQNTRIDRYISYLQHACRYGPNDASRIFKNSTDERFQIPIDWLLYVLREVHELAWILKGLNVSLPVGIDDKFKIIVSGRDFAALDVDSQSRDIQYELRIASYFCQFGCEVHLSQETDIIALASNQIFYLECKRVGSEAQLQKRLAEARKQLAGRIPTKGGHRKAYGCVAADVTKVAFPSNGFTAGLTNDHSRDVIQNELISIARDVQNMLPFRDCKHLLFYWLQIHIPALIYHPLTPVTRFSSIQITRDRLDRKERKAACMFYGILESSSKIPDVREKPAQKLNLRREVHLPAGVKFRTDDRLLTELMEGEDVDVDENAVSKVVGTLSMNGTDHDFTVFDFQTLPAAVAEEWKAMVSADPVKANLMVLLEMYLRRFPYEE